MNATPHILQVFPSFVAGGAQVRFTRLANAFGIQFRYTIVALDGQFDAATLLDSKIQTTLTQPETRTFPGCAIAMRKLIHSIRPDLVVTNNWGSMDAVLGGWTAGVCPIIHSEDGFGEDEAAGLKWRRVAFRRILLKRIHTTVVPSRTLLDIAQHQFRLSPPKITFIPNGIEAPAAVPNRCTATRRTIGATEDTLVIGFLGHLRPEKALHILIAAFARANLPDARLVIVGDGECRKGLVKLAETLGVARTVHFVGHAVDTTSYLRSFDILALSSVTEQMPMAILEAMAHALPVVATSVGDCADMLGTTQPPIIVPPQNVTAYSDALSTLARAPELRRRLGFENRKRCLERYSFDTMLRSYAGLYQSVLRSMVPISPVHA